MLKTEAILPAAQVRETAKGKPKHIFSRALPYLMVAPSLTIFSVFVLYPIFYMIYLSFFKRNMIGPKTFIGLKNFTDMFADPEFWQVLGNSFQYMFFTVVLSVGLALPLAVYLKANTRVNRFLQGVVFTPYVVSLVSISFVWMWLMDSDYGLLNYLLELLHLPAVGWLNDPDVAMYSLITVSVWKSLGYNAMILLSGMQSIPPYLYEAANLDKSSGMTTFFKITLPLLSPTLFFLTLMNMISSFKVFETVNIMTSGGPMNSTNTLVYDIYLYGFSYYKIGYASAMGVVLMIIIGICTIFYFRSLSRRVHYR